MKKSERDRGAGKPKEKRAPKPVKKIKAGPPRTKGDAAGEVKRPAEEKGRPEDVLRHLKRENQFLVGQLIKASSMLRDLENKFNEASHKQTVGKVIVAGLLHDLRNPLAVISSCAQSCLDDPGVNSPVQEKLQMILDSSRKAADLAKNFLWYAKSSILDYRPVNINRLLMVIWKMSELESAPCQVNFEARLESGLPEIIGSQENLERVFLNLFMNAIHAVSRKGKIIVETRSIPSEEMVEIRITDDGPGIPPDRMERIFEPFFTTKEGGTGLGLSICQSFILQHKGSISLDSQLGRGTAVSVKLPIRQNDAAENKGPEETPSR